MASLPEATELLIHTFPCWQVYFMELDKRLSIMIDNLRRSIYTLLLSSGVSCRCRLICFSRASGSKLLTALPTKEVISVSSTWRLMASLSIFWKSRSCVTMFSSFSVLRCANASAECPFSVRGSSSISFKGALMRVSGVRISCAMLMKKRIFWSESLASSLSLYALTR